MKWEYRIVTKLIQNQQGVHLFEMELNKLGQDGWEAGDIAKTAAERFALLVLLKRPIGGAKSPPTFKELTDRAP